MLEDYLRKRVIAAGSLSLEAFLQEILYHPTLGYYATKLPIGKKGDYITAPEMTQVFAEVIALWFYQQWQRLGSPNPFHFIELGPGRGTFMKDALRTAQRYPEFFQSLRVYLVEKSPLLQSEQAQQLVNYSVFWVGKIEDIPLAPCLIFANEFFDALPCQQIFYRQQQWFEKHLTWDGNRWKFVAKPTNNPAFFPEEATVVYEFSPAARAIAYAIAQRLARHGGTALIIDYGYQGPLGADTLQGMRAHRYHCPFTNLGEVDLSHQVDFTPLKEAFSASAVHTYPLEPMGEFLARLGLGERTERLAAQTTATQRQLLLTAAVRLLNPAHMGHLFKVLIGEVMPWKP